MFLLGRVFPAMYSLFIVATLSLIPHCFQKKERNKNKRKERKTDRNINKQKDGKREMKTNKRIKRCIQRNLRNQIRDDKKN